MTTDTLWAAGLAMLTLPPGGRNVTLTHDKHGNQVAAAGSSLIFTLSEGTLYAWVRDEDDPLEWRCDNTWEEPVSVSTIFGIHREYPQMKGSQP